ncbi:MAG: FAD/NAD(P)-binding protein [Corynebacterium sp.]|nr:FAD/NAD(P)-binding protein [Corynebacterium sp.]
MNAAAVNPCSIAIIGAGPRGISVIERLAAALQDDSQPVALHVIDDAQLGAGRIWETTQTPTLCMNTLAGAVTLFTEPESTVHGKVMEGPTMYEWIQLLRGDEAPEINFAKRELLAKYPVKLPTEFIAEAVETRPESNPSRAFYGLYLRWAYRVAVGELPQQVQLIEHHSRAVRLESVGQQDEITLADGTTLLADQTVLATGWQRPAWNAEEEQLSQAAGIWIAPDNPVEQDIAQLPAGEEVLVRGLGMGFFDVMALATIDRGGKFVADESACSGLRYEPSGKEPVLVVSSGRGYPYLPKSEYKSLPPAADLSNLQAVIAKWNAPELAGQRIDFSSEVWPAVVRDTYTNYYRTLAANTEVELDLAAIEAIIATANPDNIEERLAPLVTAVEPFHMARWEQPLADYQAGIAELTEYIATGMTRDIAEAVAARKSSVKAALWAISAARKSVSILGAEDRYTYESRAQLQRYMAFGQMVGSGPPLFRTRQLLALIDADLVRFLGTYPNVTVTSDGFCMESATTQTPVESRYLVDAWMHSPDVRALADPLMKSLGDRIAPFKYRAAEALVPSASPAADPVTRAVIDVHGEHDPRVHLVGIPTYAQFPDTTISPMPGTDPLMLQETDKVAQHVAAQVRKVVAAK